MAEQLLLLPVRLAAGPIPPYFDPLDDDLGAVWLVVVVGLGTETAIIALLGGLAGRAAVKGLPTFPATTTSRPAARRIAPRSSLVVVFPFVPVTPRIAGLPRSR